MGLADTVLSWPGASGYKATDSHIVLAFAAFGVASLVIHVLHYRMERLTLRKKVGLKGDKNLR